jgi:uncharacterized protein YdeI (YjbR/CyaY-like superfamily)
MGRSGPARQVIGQSGRAIFDAVRPVAEQVGAMKSTTKARFFESGTAFRAWLDANHDRSREILVGFYKKASGRGGMTYQEALDEALAYGWIDGVRKSLDADRWTIRFTPRKAHSIWSNVNVKRMKELVALGRVTTAGLRAFEAREERRTGVYGYERSPTRFDMASGTALAANAPAKKFFDAQPPGYKRLATGWVMGAKKEETRAKRLARLIELSSRARRIDFMKPNG